MNEDRLMVAPVVLSNSVHKFKMRSLETHVIKAGAESCEAACIGLERGV